MDFPHSPRIQVTSGTAIALVEQEDKISAVTVASFSIFMTLPQSLSPHASLRDIFTYFDQGIISTLLFQSPLPTLEIFSILTQSSFALGAVVSYLSILETGLRNVD